MNSGDRKIIAAFVAQRMEMGEAEWYFKPDMTVIHTREATEPITSSEAVQAHRNSRSSGGQVVNQTHMKETADSIEVSEAAIAQQDTYEDLYNAVNGCMRCPLHAQRKNFVFGDGNPNADIMFIGEAPGADEDEQGLPFVGRCGKLLTKMIEAIKLTRDEVYIGNILKCRPPMNRDPLRQEIEICEPILIRQIEIIKPEIICALGRIAGQTLLRTKSTLGALRGRIHDYHGVKLIVTYHPAALLRNPNWKAPAWDDLKFLRREYDGMEIT